jgi:hypothetical protein
MYRIYRNDQGAAAGSEVRLVHSEQLSNLVDRGWNFWKVRVVRIWTPWSPSSFMNQDVKLNVVKTSQFEIFKKVVI